MLNELEPQDFDPRNAVTTSSGPTRGPLDMIHLRPGEDTVADAVAVIDAPEAIQSKHSASNLAMLIGVEWFNGGFQALSPLHTPGLCLFATAGTHVDGPVEQGGHNSVTRFCGLEYDGDGRGFYSQADRLRTGRCAAHFPGLAGQIL